VSQHSAREISDILNHYAEYIRTEIDCFNKASTLPLVGARREIVGRKIAADILSPVADALSAYASQYFSEDEAERSEPKQLGANAGYWDYDA
jgi:hypothetical protein